MWFITRITGPRAGICSVPVLIRLASSLHSG